MHRRPTCHSEFAGPYARTLLATLGEFGWESCGTTIRNRTARDCNCLRLRLSPNATAAFYGALPRPPLVEPPLFVFGDVVGSEGGEISGHTGGRVLMSRIGLPGDGINPMCSGGCALYGVQSIGKAGQLACRRSFTRRAGCEYESLGLQAAQYDLSIEHDCAAWRQAARAADHAWLLKPAVSAFGIGIRCVRPSD